MTAYLLGLEMTEKGTYSVSISIHQIALNEFSGLCCPRKQGDAEKLHREATYLSNHQGLVCSFLLLIATKESKEAMGLYNFKN